MNETSPLVNTRKSQSPHRIVQLAWNGINTLLIILTLFVLVLTVKLNDNNNGENPQSPALITLTSNTTLKPGDIVSISASGMLEKGAGISLYRFTNEFAIKEEVKHLHSVYLPNGITVMCYYSQYATLLTGKFNDQTMTMEWSNSVSLASQKLSCDCLERMKDTNVLVLIGGSKMVPITVDDMPDGVSLKLGQVTEYTHGFSVDPRISVLSHNRVALSFYHTEDENTTLNTAVIQVDGYDQTATFSTIDKQIYSVNHGSHQVMAFNNISYVLCHPKDNYPSVEGGALSCMLVVVPDSNISIGPETVLNYVQMNYFFDMTLLSPTRAVVVFTDMSIDNGIRGVVLELLRRRSGEYYLDFGSSIIINSGHGSGVLPSGAWLYLNAETIGADRFVVVYSDLSNEGRITATIGEISVSASLNLISPELILSEPNPYLSQYYWIDVSVINDNMFLVFDSLTGSNPSSRGGSISIGHLKGSVLGVVTRAISGHKSKNYEVILRGEVSVSQNQLVPGRMYYTNSKGELIAGGFHGDISELDPENYLISGKDIVTDSSVVGVALTNSKLLLY